MFHVKQFFPVDNKNVSCETFLEKVQKRSIFETERAQFIAGKKISHSVSERLKGIVNFIIVKKQIDLI